MTTAVPPTDEGRHPPDAETFWNESWYFDFAAADGSVGGYVRLGLCPGLGAAWYWACLIGEGRPLVTVIDHDVPLPERSLEIRTEGLWADHTCETPLDHWTLGCEAFAVALADPAEAYGPMRGNRVPFGLDLEWETDGGCYPYPGVTRYEVPCRVQGIVQVGDERIEVDAPGQRDHSWGGRDWWAFGWVWTSGELEDGTRFHATKPRIEGIDFEVGYVQPPGRALEPVTRFRPEEQLGDEGLPTEARFELGPLALGVTPLHFAPVAIAAPDGRVTRLARAMCRFQAEDGRHGIGWTEWNQPQSQG